MFHKGDGEKRPSLMFQTIGKNQFNRLELIKRKLLIVNS